MRKNGHDVEVTRPLKHRPEVIVIKTSDGRKKVVGDGGGFSSDELVTLHGGITESTRPPLQFSEAERAAIEAAEEQLARASALVDEIWRENVECGRKIDQLCQDSVDPWGNPKPGGGAENEVHRLQDQAREIRARLQKATEVEQDALTERNEVRRRVTTAATTRQFPPQFHTPSRSTDERLDDLERK